MSVLPDTYEKIDHLVSEAEQLVERRNPQALPLAEEIMQMAIQNGSLKQFAQAKYILAFYNCLVANDYDKAITICEEVLSKTDKEDLQGIAYKIYMTLGNSYQLRGEVFSAQESYMRGLKELEERPVLNKKEKGFLASFYYNLSLVMGHTALNISAEDYLEKAIEIYKETENKFKLSKSYSAYANVLESKKEYAKALELMEKSLEIDESLNEPYSIALSHANLGILQLRLKQTEPAFQHLNKALDYFGSKKMDYETAMVKLNIGQVLHANEQLDESVATLLETEAMFEKLENKRELMLVYQLLSDFIAEQKRFEEALSYHRKYTSLLKGIFDLEKTNALTRAKKEFESEQKEKEAELLRQKNEEINHYVLKLERSNNELKQFAHVASHDLREPLRMITSYITLLQKTLKDLSPQQNEFMGFAIDGAKRMELLIVDLLRLAKVDANPRIEPVRLSTVAEEIKLNLEVLIKEKNAIITYTDLPEIMADRTMISQLFQNIVGNGMKYNESEQPTIRIRHRYLQGGNLEITIADNGIGIPVALREKAFQIFQRLPTQKKYSGSGIGLAICKKIVETFGGKISIDDNPTGGSIFKMEFPASVITSS